MMPQEARWIHYACVGRTLLSAAVDVALDFDLSNQPQHLVSIASEGLNANQSRKLDDKSKINLNGGGQECPPHTRIQTTLVLSSTNFLSPSSTPSSWNEFVTIALPFSTLVMTYEQPNQCASAKSVVDQRAGWSGCEW